MTYPLLGPQKPSVYFPWVKRIMVMTASIGFRNTNCMVPRLHMRTKPPLTGRGGMQQVQYSHEGFMT